MKRLAFGLVLCFVLSSLTVLAAPLAAACGDPDVCVEQPPGATCVAVIGTPVIWAKFCHWNDCEGVAGSAFILGPQRHPLNVDCDGH